MVLLDTYPETQYQNPDPIKPQPPIPGGVHEMEVSWDRTEGYMRLIIGSGKWWFKDLGGKAVMLGTDNTRGRWNLLGKAQLKGESLVLWRPSDAPTHPMVLGTTYDSSYQRLCYRHAKSDWRVNDERQAKLGNPGSLKFVQGYVGDMVLEWELEDTIAHLYHKGPWIDCDPGCFMHSDGGWAHFYESL